MELTSLSHIRMRSPDPCLLASDVDVINGRPLSMEAVMGMKCLRHFLRLNICEQVYHSGSGGVRREFRGMCFP